VSYRAIRLGEAYRTLDSLLGPLETELYSVDGLQHINTVYQFVSSLHLLTGQQPHHASATMWIPTLPAASLLAITAQIALSPIQEVPTLKVLSSCAIADVLLFLLFTKTQLIRSDFLFPPVQRNLLHHTHLRSRHISSLPSPATQFPWNQTRSIIKAQRSLPAMARTKRSRNQGFASVVWGFCRG